MLPYKDDTDYGWEWYREWLQGIHRVRRRRGWRAAKARDLLHQAAEWLRQWYDREGERCIELGPACELYYG